MISIWKQISLGVSDIVETVRKTDMTTIYLKTLQSEDEQHSFSFLASYKDLDDLIHNYKLIKKTCSSE